MMPLSRPESTFSGIRFLSQENRIQAAPLPRLTVTGEPDSLDTVIAEIKKKPSLKEQFRNLTNEEKCSLGVIGGFGALLLVVASYWGIGTVNTHFRVAAIEQEFKQLKAAEDKAQKVRQLIGNPNSGVSQWAIEQIPTFKTDRERLELILSGLTSNFDMMKANQGILTACIENREHQRDLKAIFNHRQWNRNQPTRRDLIEEFEQSIR